MNYIKKLQQEVTDAQFVIEATNHDLFELYKYLLSDKFAGPDKDFIYISTDLLPKIEKVRTILSYYRAHKIPLTASSEEG